MFPGGKANRQLDWAKAKDQGLATANSQEPRAKNTTRSEHGMDKGKKR